jgi:hypothetical protein
MMAAWGMHLDFPPDVAGGALFPYLESMADEIRLKSSVARIESDASGATGV